METAFLVLRIFMAAVLYAFLGLSLWLLWTQLRLQADRTASAVFPELLLTLDEAESISYRFNRSEVIVGRQPGCDLRLQDGTISARHARLSYHHGQWWAEDLHSRNGTFLNDERLTSPIVVAGGDILRFGSITLRITIQSDSDQANSN